MTYQELEDLAQEAWMEHSVTEVYESHHWYELAKEEFIQDYITKHGDEMRVEIAQRADSLKKSLDDLDLLLDSLSNREAEGLNELYKSLNAILESQLCLIRNKPSLKIVKEKQDEF